MLILAILFTLLISLVWTGSLLLELQWWIPAVASAVLVFTYVGILVFRRIRAVRRQAAMERELERQAAKQAAHVAPDKRPEIIALRKQMKEAVDTLKRSKLGARSGRAALYTLPWYVIVGPPAAGKTTAITQSGLNLVGGSKAKIRGTAGTRNCDWWFTRDAILLDTAGRFAMDDDDQEEWHTFLDTVRRFRPARPIDGVVVAVSVSDLLTQEQRSVEELASRLRERLDELMSRLEMVLPIYILFTKTDLVSGFVEFFGDCSKQQRGQVWGATFALDDARLDEPGKAFEGEFRTLISAMHARMVQRLARENHTQTRQKILQFLVEFAELEVPIARFIEELSRPDPYHDTPLLRGFYFSSGTQVGSPIDLVLNKMLGSYGLHLPSPPAPPPSEARSYFVTDLFAKVIFLDRNVAVRSSSRVKRNQRLQMLLVGAAVLATLMVLIPAMLSYGDNRQLTSATLSDVTAAESLAATGRPEDSFRAVERIAKRVAILEHEAKRFQLLNVWGPHTAPRLLEVTRQRYAQYLRQVIEQPVRARLAGEILQINNQRNFTVDGFRSSYDRLKLSLMLAQPEHLREPGSEAQEPLDCEAPRLAWAAEELANAWMRAAQVTTAATREGLQSHACYYLRAVAEQPEWAWSLDDNERAALAAAQVKLSRDKGDVDGRCLDWLAEKYKSLPPLRANDVFVAPATRYFTTRVGEQVPGLYTAEGWRRIRDEFSETDALIAYEPWVLGQGSEAEELPVCSADTVRSLYFERYVRAWSVFLEDLQVERPEDPKAAVEELRVLSDSNGPYVRLFEVLRENTRLDMAKRGVEGVLDKAKKAVSERFAGDTTGETPREVSPVERHFEPLLRFGFGDSVQKGPSGLSQYLRELTNLEVRLSQVAEGAGAPDSELGNAAQTVNALLGGLDNTNRNLLAPLLMNPIIGGIKTSEDSAFQSLNDSWKKEVWDFWNGNLAKRYPFANSASDASVAEFAEFFRPNSGIFWSFFNDKLSGMLEGSSRGYGPSATANAGRFRSDFLNCLTIAHAITDAVFGGGMEPRVEFEVKVLPAGKNVAKIVLKIDSQALTYANTPEKWTRMSWPRTDGRRLGALEVEGRGLHNELSFAGEFGFFRLLHQGGLQAAGNSTLKATWRIASSDAPPISIEVKPAKAAHPFERRFFSRLSCPSSIALSGAGR